MKNKYSQLFEHQMQIQASTHTLEQLLHIARDCFGYDITKKQLQLYLSKRQIRYKDYHLTKVRDMGKDAPIGTEYIKPDGMVLVKVAKDKWQYKQRIIYEEFYNVKLKSDDYIIFLDQDRTNFDINNLRKVTRRESAILANQELFSKYSQVTETGIDVAKLIIAMKDKRKECN